MGGVTKNEISSNRRVKKPSRKLKSRRNVWLKRVHKIQQKDNATTRTAPECKSLQKKQQSDITAQPGCSHWESYEEKNPVNNDTLSAVASSLEKNIPSVLPNFLNSPPKQIYPEGRRLVDVSCLFKQFPQIANHTPFDCTIADMYVIKEQRKGLQSSFILKCKMCGIEKNLQFFDDTEDTQVNVNSSITLGIVSTGIGYSAAEELMGVLNVPFMSPQTYQKCHAEISSTIHETAWKSMEEGALEEANIARELGEVDKNQIPFITVIADGAWSKRSYNVNYDAASGVACIIGQRTGKVLFLGIKNKYCCLCSRAEAKGLSPIPEHLCFKNWKGTSTRMESEIIVEGFKRSVEMYGIQYLRLVGDGDSSVTKRLIEARPYGNVLVQKVECRNHLLRNFSNKMREICNRKRSSSKNVPVSPLLRKIVTSNVLRLRTAVTKATAYRIAEESTFEQKVGSLCEDIKNCPSHVFGEHKECAKLRYFKCSPKDNEKNLVPDMMACGLYQDIETCLNRLIYNASSLICNMNNNLAEQYNAVVCKFVGGKRINFSLKGSYTTRCEAAAISFNSEGNYHRVMHKALIQKSPSAFTGKYLNKIKTRRLYYRQKRNSGRQLFKSARKREVTLPDEDYGAIAIETQDLVKEEFNEKRQTFLSSLRKTAEEVVTLEERTRGQGGNPMWKQERSLRLTASNFGSICKMRPNTSCENKVKELLYTKFMGNNATQYGTDHEPFALKQFENEYKLEVSPCGLFIDAEHGIFGASPDGLIGETGVIEIKCPKKIQTVTPLEGIKKNS